MRNSGYANQIVHRPLGEVPRLQPAAATKTIPFDYVFQFGLQGIRGNKVQDVVQISVEGIFAALSVGYSLVTDERQTKRTFGPEINQRTVPPSPAFVPFFGPVPPLEIDPGPIFLVGDPPGRVGPPAPAEDDLTGIEIVAAPGIDISVLSEVPTTAGNPVSLSAKTTKVSPTGFARVSVGVGNASGAILRIWDRTNNLLSQPFEVGDPSTPVIGPSATTGKLPAAGDKTVSVYGFGSTENRGVVVFLLKASGSTNQFDATLQSSGRITLRGTRFKADVNLGGQSLSPGDVLVATALQANAAGVHRSSVFVIPRPTTSTIPLGALAAGLERIGADLTDGLRLNPTNATLLAADFPLDQLSVETLTTAFQTGSTGAEEVNFLYSIDVSGTGREYQNRAIHNIAGLGIANGDRPFRPFAKPVMFEPKSSIRIQVEEISGPAGTLFIVLQGYKMLGTARVPV